MCRKDVQLLSLYDRDLPDTVRRNSARRPIAASAVAPRVASQQAPCVVRRPRREPNQLRSLEWRDRWCVSLSQCCRRSTRCVVRCHRRATTVIININSSQSPPSRSRRRRRRRRRRNRGASCRNEATRPPTSRYTSDRPLLPRNRRSRRPGTR